MIIELGIDVNANANVDMNSEGNTARTISESVLELQPIGRLVHHRYLPHCRTQLILDMRFALQPLPEMLYQLARVGDLSIPNQLDNLGLNGISRYTWSTWTAST